MPSSFEVTIRPRRGWQPIDIKEILLYREVLAFLVWRDIKIRYRQTLLGGRWAILPNLLWLPIFILAAVLAASGVGLTLSAFNVSFRDVKYAVPFLIQMGIFVTPVIYPIRYIPGHWKILMGLNPMAGVVLGFRYALLGSPYPWPLMGLSLIVSVVLFIFGLLIFRRMERRFADII